LVTHSPIGLYVHIPFCTAKCGYCDFNSYAKQEHLVPSYTQSLLREAELWQSATRGRTVGTVFFGGGTPSLMPLEEMRTLIDGLRAAFDIVPDAEVTLEANPGSIDQPYLRGLRDLGVNRLSIGVQSFHDDELRTLDRLHTAQHALDAFAAARAAGFDNISIDLIFGLPEQSLERWQETLEQAVALAPVHLSCYALTVEEETPLANAISRGRTRAPDGDAQADHYEWTRDRLERAGYEQYEISNWSRPGRRCRHNLIYWEAREYLGLGAGAHSHLDGVRFSTAKLPQAYQSLVDESFEARSIDGDAPMRQVVSGETITRELAMADALILGLRLNDGINLAKFRERFAVDAMEQFAGQLSEPLAAGLVEIIDGRLRLTERGLLLSNEVFVRLLPD
jgi:oxygen-independent coproporphyrinogen-3 oxidase